MSSLRDIGYAHLTDFMGWLSTDWSVFKLYTSAHRFEITHDGFEGCAFPYSIPTYNANSLTLVYIKVNPKEDLTYPVTRS